LKEPCPPDILQKLSTLKPAVYNKTLVSIRQLLGLKTSLTLSSLAVTFGATQMVEPAEKCLQHFKDLIEAMAGPGSKVDWDEDRWIAGAFWTLCTSFGVKSFFLNLLFFGKK